MSQLRGIGTCIRLATSDDGDAVGSLRIDEYRASKDFFAPNEEFTQSLRWGEADRNAQVLTVWRDGVLIATMRAETLRDRAHATFHFEEEAPPEDHVEWPAVILRSAATRSGHRGAGLNSLMRLHIINALVGSGIHRLYGHVVQGGVRTRVMRDIGYEFAARVRQEFSLPSRDPWAIAWLDIPKMGGRATEILAGLVRIEAEEFPWYGPRSNFDMAVEKPEPLSLSLS